MRVDVLTLFPEMVAEALTYSIPGRAQKNGKLAVHTTFMRDFAVDKRGTVDDAPYGGGPGMVLRVDVAHAALESADPRHKALRIMLTPDGELFDQRMAKKLATEKQIVLLCGRYEGFDARIEKYIDKKVSVGNYVVSGGELPAMIIVDAVARLLPGVLGNEESLKHETFENNTTDFPQYTRPEEYDGVKVPEILLSGHHAEIESWRNEQKRRTA